MHRWFEGIGWWMSRVIGNESSLDKESAEHRKADEEWSKKVKSNSLEEMS